MSAIPIGYKWWMVADSESPENMGLSANSGSQANITIDVDLSKSNRLVNLSYVIADIIGYPSVIPVTNPRTFTIDGATFYYPGYISRKLPWQHPRLSFMWAEKISRVLGRKFQSKKWNPVTALSYSEYNYYRIDIAFSIPAYEIFSDSQIGVGLVEGQSGGDEFLRFTSFTSQAGIENITRQGQYLRWANVSGYFTRTSDPWDPTTNPAIETNATRNPTIIPSPAVLRMGNPGTPPDAGNSPNILSVYTNAYNRTLPNVLDDVRAQTNRALPFPGGVTVRTPKVYYTFTWHQVPGLALFGRSGFGVPLNLVNAVGRVNDFYWPTRYVINTNGTFQIAVVPEIERFPPETLLFLKYNVKPETIPVSADLISPLITGKIPRTYKVEFETLYFNPRVNDGKGFRYSNIPPNPSTFGTGSPYPIVGHNGAPFPGTSDFYRLSTAANTLDRDTLGRPMNRLYSLFYFSTLFQPSYA